MPITTQEIAIVERQAPFALVISDRGVELNFIAIAYCTSARKIGGL